MKFLRFVSVFSFVLALACSSKTKTETPTPSKPPRPSAEIGKGSIGNLLKEKAIRVSFSEAEFAMKISEYVAKRPFADYEDVAEFANTQLKNLGMAFDLISLDAEPMGTDTLVRTVDQKWLNVGLFWEPLCAEGIAVRYPISEFKKDQWTLRYNSGTYIIRAKPVRTGEIVRLKDNKVVYKIPLPEEGFEPGGITSNGKSLLGKLLLNAAANRWWRESLRRDPKDEPPFIVYVLAEDEFEFSEDESDLDSFEHAPNRQKIDDERYEITFPDSKYKFRSHVCT